MNTPDLYLSAWIDQGQVTFHEKSKLQNFQHRVIPFMESVQRNIVLYIVQFTLYTHTHNLRGD